MSSILRRRRVLGMTIASGLTLLTAPLRTFGQQTVRRTPGQILGPFYPVTKPKEHDADLTTFEDRSGRRKDR